MLPKVLTTRVKHKRCDGHLLQLILIYYNLDIHHDIDINQSV